MAEFQIGQVTNNHALLRKLMDEEGFIIVKPSAQNITNGVQGHIALCSLACWGKDMFGGSSQPRVVPYKDRPGYYFGVTDQATKLRYFVDNPRSLAGSPAEFDKTKAPMTLLFCGKDMWFERQEVRVDTREQRLARNKEYTASGRKAKTLSSKRGPRKFLKQDAAWLQPGEWAVHPERSGGEP